MIIGVNCCHLSDKTDCVKNRLVNFYFLLSKVRLKNKFVFFVTKNFDIHQFNKLFI